MIITQFIILEIYARFEQKKSFKIIPTPNNITLALLGTSHANYGPELSSLNPKIFDYGNGYTYPIIMYHKLQNLIKNCSDLKYLIIEADYSQFYDFSFENPYIYSKYRNLLNDDKSLIISLEKEVSLMMHKRIFHQLISKLLDTKLVNDKIWSQLSLKTRERNTKSRYDFFTFSKEKNMNINSVDYYRQTIELAQKNDIEVILIRNPLSNEYLDNMYPKIQIDVESFINAISIKYDLKIFDYRYTFRDEQNLFSDMDHLNTRGSEILKKILMDDIMMQTDFMLN
jgi:hypothetical protein